MIIFLSKGRILFVIFAILGRLDECADKSCMLVGCMIIDQQSTVDSALSTGSGMLIVLRQSPLPSPPPSSGASVMDICLCCCVPSQPSPQH